MTDNHFHFITTAKEWQTCLSHLKRWPRVAVDLEANSLYVYQEYICLLQFSTEEQDFIVDPLAGFPLLGLGDLLQNPKIEKIFHASEYDLILLKEAYGVEAVNLFDTMWAGRILGYKNMGLAAFLESFLQITVSKKHQKANWSKRPLSAEQLAYAQNDTRYLIQLRDLMSAELEKRGQMEEALEIFRNETRVKSPDRSFDAADFYGLRGARRMPPQMQAVLRELFILRDREAKARNVPPFKVLNNDVLLHLAKLQPANEEELLKVRGISERVLQRMGTSLLRAVARGRKAPPPEPPVRNNRKSNRTMERFECLSDWRKQRAQERDVESDVILKRDTMWEIAALDELSMDTLKTITTLGPHRFSLYGEDLLRLLQGVDGS
ncbi:MAG: HRDC domain-containing protein [Candidatus Hydrogenedentes bacterium]|nr:HRDC domain-containing protein [Candidatus Hydrogenedentota bacterium]